MGYQKAGMGSDKTTVLLTRRKKALFYAAYLFILAVLFVAGAEIILRIRGLKPWRNDAISIQVEPGGKFFTKHPTLGYSHIPGRFTVTLPSGYSFKVTHLPNTLRIAGPIDGNKKPEAKEGIWIFGCSFTHGWYVNDEETYPWLLQERLPEYDIVNFGVSGYGTIHSLLQFQKALHTNTPRLAVLGYANFHDARNTFSRVRRKSIAPMNKLGPLVQPYARVDKKGDLHYLFADVEYTEFPLMRHLALVNFIESNYDLLEYKWNRSHAVSEALVAEMASLAKKHNVKFMLANISGGDAMLDFAAKNGIANVDLFVEFGPANDSRFPNDGHPCVIENRQYAEKLERALRATLLE